MTPSVLVEPAFHWCPPYAKTYGDEVADLARLAGFAPDPEQELALADLFAVDTAGKAAVFEFGIVAPRQNIKTGLFKQAALGWLFITDQNLVVWSAHEFSTAQEAFRDMTILIESCPDLDRRVKQIHRGNGDEAIELLTGQRLKFRARTHAGGRGLTGDKVVLDEAFALQPSHMGALMPTLSAVPDPQVVYGSSAGLVTSAILRDIRDRGRPGGAASLGYIEFCDDLPGECATEDCGHEKTAVGCRLDDPRRWARGNSQLGRRITLEYVQAERQALPPEEFARERHGWWDEPPEEVLSALAGWPLLTAPAPTSAPDAFAVDRTPDQEWCSVGVSCVAHVEIVEHRRGSAWVVEACSELDAAHPRRPFAVDPRGPAASLIPDLKKAGLRVVEPKPQDHVRACATFLDAVVQRALTHGGQAPLDAAVAGAKQRPVGDGWLWDRKKAAIISPLCAVTLARWAATRRKAAGKGRVLILE